MKGRSRLRGVLGRSGLRGTKCRRDVVEGGTRLRGTK